MNRADTVFQESFLSTLEGLENGRGEQGEATAIDKLAAATGLADESGEEVTYDGLLAKLAAKGDTVTRATSDTRGRQFATSYRASAPKSDDSSAYQAALARKAMPSDASFGTKMRGYGARASHFARTNKKPLLAAGAGLAAAGAGYAAYRMMKKKDKDD